MPRLPIPEDHVACPICKGDGAVSKYDQGWRSLTHSPELAAKRTCWRCGGLGYIPAEDPRVAERVSEAEEEAAEARRQQMVLDNQARREGKRTRA